MRLKDAVLALLCPFTPRSSLKIQYCECEDPQPVRYGCGYGECEILRCQRCGRVVTYKWGSCYYPNSR